MTAKKKAKRLRIKAASRISTIVKPSTRKPRRKLKRDPYPKGIGTSKRTGHK